MQPLLKILKANYMSFKSNLKDISHAESIEIPHEHVNPLNWIAGHIVVVRDQPLNILKEKPLVTTKWVKVYDTGTKPDKKMVRKFVQLDKIKETYEASQLILVRHLEAPDEALIDEKVELQIADYLYHEAYHIGQMGTIRRFIGKPGAFG